jgi:tryptophan 2,3-dioxygenase
MPRYIPVFPDLIDASQVNTSLDPRPMGMTTDESRIETAKSTDGAPLVDYEGNANPYIDYQSIDILLSLQHPRSDGYDEMCFFIMGQVKELMFRGLHFELFNAREQIRQDNHHDALVILNRAGIMVDYIQKSWDVLQTITTEGFNEFRDNLSTASGQLSFMYRHVEFILGNKNKRLAAAHRNVKHVWPAMERALYEPSLYDEAIMSLNRNGHKVDKQALDRVWSDPYQSNASVRKAWLEVYQEPHADNVEYLMAEAFISLDEKISVYRWRHFTSVHKIIGFKPGTGGSAGVGWLQHVTEHSFFPELWEVRDDM